MRQYRHKPSGEIVTEMKDTGMTVMYEDRFKGKIFALYIHGCSDWEEIVTIDESKWFVKQFIHTTYKSIWKIQSDNKYRHGTSDNGSPASFFLRTPEYGIYSVTRVQDSKTFTVGDVLIIGNNASNLKTIERIEQHKDGFTFIVSNGKERYGIGSAKLWQEPEYKYETADGVTLKKFDDKLYSVLTKANWDKGTTTVHNTVTRAEKIGTTWLFFSTPEARDEYILNNKPLISLTDLKAFEDVKISTKSLTNLKAHIIKRG